MLCKVCSNLDIDRILRPASDPRAEGDHPFHDKLSDIHVSAAQGCDFCSLVDEQLRKWYKPEKLEKYSDEPLFIGLGSKYRPHVAGESELWIRSKLIRTTNGLRYSLVMLYFTLCIPRSEVEWRPGCR